jgi:formylglycine-generating enzyme required for sulfatase activity
MKKLTLSICSVAIALSLTAFKPAKKAPYKLPKTVIEDYAYIPEGELYLNKDSIKMNAFFISKYEITNIQYREFLADLSKSGKTAELKIAKVDSVKWGKQEWFKPMEINYHIHPAYSYYPAVNISYEGALLFCKWLTEKINANAEDGLKYIVRLPSRNEWMRGAQGDSKFQPDYAWGDFYVRDTKGEYRANFVALGSENIHYNDSLKKYDVIPRTYFPNRSIGFRTKNTGVTCDVKSYAPTKNGLHNMNGNVAEMVSEKNIAVGGCYKSTGYDIRNDSKVTYSEPAPTIGFRPVIEIVQN